MSGRSFLATAIRDKKDVPSPLPAELVTYRLDDEMVYVEPARDYHQALEYARAVFPALATLPSSRIVFLVNVRVNGSLRKVRIAPMAWPRVMKSLATYEIIELAILPEFTIPINSRAAKSETELATDTNMSGDDDTPPPKYGSSSDLDYSSSLDHARHMRYKDSERSPYFTLHASDAERLSPPPFSPSAKRCTGTFNWFTKLF